MEQLAIYIIVFLCGVAFGIALRSIFIISKQLEEPFEGETYESKEE